MLLTFVCPCLRTVSEVIALKLRRPDSSHPYLYPQIFSGLSYLLAGVCILELGRVVRKRRKDADILAPSEQSSHENVVPPSFSTPVLVENRDEKKAEGVSVVS